jgi:hypothetical protein
MSERQEYLRALNRGQRVVESAGVEDPVCFVCGSHEGDPCPMCIELAMSALCGDKAAWSELAARSGRQVAKRPATSPKPARQSLRDRVSAPGRNRPRPSLGACPKRISGRKPQRPSNAMPLQNL